MPEVIDLVSSDSDEDLDEPFKTDEDDAPVLTQLQGDLPNIYFATFLSPLTRVSPRLESLVNS